MNVMGEKLENKAIKALAYKWHDGQYRKGPDKVPYIEHPKSVVALLESWCVSDPNILSIAWGHDLLEDTDCLDLDILKASNSFVLSGIKALTFVGFSKEAYIERLASSAPWEFLIVKLADRLCNTKDYIKIGRKEYALEYLKKGHSLFTNLWRIPNKELQLKITNSRKEVIDLLSR